MSRHFKAVLFVLLALAVLLTVVGISPASANKHRLVIPGTYAVSYINGASHRDYLAMGDSITCGTGTPDLHYGYAEQANLRALCAGGTGWSDSLGPNRDGSASFRRTLLPALRLMVHQPKTLIFHYGINDFGTGITAAQLIHQVKVIRKMLTHHGYRVVLGTVIPSPPTSIWTVLPGLYSPDGTTIQHNRLLYNRWVRTTGSYVDYAKALECGPERLQCPGLSNNNDCHVNPAGAALMARVLRAWLRHDRRNR